MIVRFTLENWMSFRDRVAISMVASRERQHGERVPRVKKYRTKVLPIAAIFGGNAAGKSNFFKALSFVRDLVVNGTQPDEPIPVDRFKLDTEVSERPARFGLDLLIDKHIYGFYFTVTDKEVLEEKLVEYRSTSEKVLYERSAKKINFDRSLQDKKVLQFVFRGTRDNQLFLTNSVSQNVECFRPVYDWFMNSLIFITPDCQFGAIQQFFNEKHPLHRATVEALDATVEERLYQLDTGIISLSSEEVPFNTIQISESTRDELRKNVRGSVSALVRTSPHDERVIVSRRNGGLVASKLISHHMRPDGTECRFEMNQESAGSQRAIDLLPAFATLMEAQPDGKVCIIDELDRSLHTMMTRTLLENYLDSCATDTRSQLLFTTHDVLLIDQRLLRRDEMWVTERNNCGISDMFSFSVYEDVRYDKDVQKSYLYGRLGGVPCILQ